MKPWVGAVAVAAAMLVAPGAALAGADDPAEIQFKLPNKAAIEEFGSLGASMDHGITTNADGSVLVSAWVTDAQLPLFRARGFEPVATISSKYAIDRIRAERNKTLAAEKAARDAMRAAPVQGKAKSLAPTWARAQRADYYENNVGRFLSIEANADGSHFENCRNVPQQGFVCDFVGPTLMAEWYDAAGNRIGGGQLGVYPDPDVTPWYYQYHYSRFQIGLKDDGAVLPASIKITASRVVPGSDPPVTETAVDTLAVKEWIAKDPPDLPSGYLSGFVTHYNDSQEAYQKMRDLAGEFPNIAQVYDLPEKTRGYQRKAQTMLGYTNQPTTQQPNPAAPNATTPYVRFDANNLPVAGATPATAQQAGTVVLTSKSYGQLGGNNLTAQIVDPAGAANQALGVSLTGNAIRINPATNASGAIASTAAQVVDALNANQQIANVISAATFRTNTGAGVVQAGPASPLNDLLRAPSTFPRGPQTQNMLRIGKTRDGSKVGVFFYCQEHGNEIATSGVCLETAERLVRNYGFDPETTTMIDNLDIFIIPQINGDGATHSIYDSNRRTNLSNHCEDTLAFPSKETDPASRNNWGVDLNRNFSQGSVTDNINGFFFQGATRADCTNGNFAGPFEFSEPETRNESWVQSTFPNIKFINNIHSSGGLFMWPPGAYTTARVPLPYPPYGTLNFFDQTGKEVLDRIKSHRGTAILPQQTGPVIDVLYSAAGNSADEAYYSHGIIGFDFEIGATHYNDAGQTPATCGPGQQPPFGPVSGANQCLANEGFHEAMEFASGNFGLMHEALDYSNDTTAPVVEATGKSVANVTQDVRFTSDEASSIYYTTDGSTPSTASTEWKPNRARALPLPVLITDDATLKWIAVDFKGNTSAVKSKSFLIETDKPTVTLNGFTEGQVFTQGRPVPITYSCADEAGGSGLASCVASVPSGGNLPTGTPGTFTFTVTATDNAGNVTTLSRSYTVLTATNTNGGVNGSVPATLSLTLGAAPQFGTLTPGVMRTYLASTMATVTSSAGDALLSVADPSSNATGHLVNGTFSLPQPLQARARNATNTSTAYNNVGSSASPLNLLTWSGPISNDAVSLEFSQLVDANDALRTGTYSKALTFTLSTTQP